VAVDALGTSQTPEEDSDMGDRKVLVDHRVRYADDFVITAVSQDLLANEVRPWVEAFLAQRGLRLSPANTRFHTH
jgi:RNA-directed DNA polymerase